MHCRIRRRIVDQYQTKIHVCVFSHLTLLETCFVAENAVKKYMVSVPHRRRQTINYKTGTGGRSLFFLKAVYDERVGSQLKERNPLAG